MKKVQICLLIAFCGLNVWGQTVKKSVTQTDTNKSAQKDNTQTVIVSLISDEEYKVYNAFLGQRKAIFVIRDKTNMDADSKNIKMLEQRGFGDFFLKKIKAETLTDFLAKNDKSDSLEKKISPDIDYVFISTDELKKNFGYKFDGEMNWEGFRQKYLKASNIYTFSRVGFSQDGTQALVFVTNWCGYTCGEGNYYVLKKENCEWKIIDKVMTWIS